MEGPPEDTPGAFPLGTVLFDGTPAEGHEHPQERVPAAWERVLARKHADPAMFGSLFVASPETRDWVLRSASKAHCTLDSSQRTAEQQHRQLSAVGSALNTRGDLHTRLTVCSSDPQYLSLLADQLQGVGQGIKELAVCCLGEPTPIAVQARTTFIAGVSSVLPNVNLLWADSISTLPPSPHLPSLRRLGVSMPADQVDLPFLRSAAPYLARIHAFSCEMQPGRHGYTPVACQVLFETPGVYTALKAIRLPAVLDDELLGLLLKRTPGLSNVHLASLSAGLTQHRHKQWAVANLTLDNGETNLTHLACLPTSTAKGRVVVNSTKKFLLPAGSLLGVVGERLSEWTFKGKALHLVPSEQPVSLFQVLEALTVMQAPDVTVMLVDLPMIGHIAQLLAVELPKLSHLKFGVHVRHVTDAVLGLILQMGTVISELSADTLALQSDQHANAVWPWSTLRLKGIWDVRALLRLPHPSTSTRVPTVDSEMLLRPDLTEDDGARLIAWLGHVHWAGFGFDLQGSPDPAQAALVIARHASILRAVRQTRSARIKDVSFVHFCNSPLTPDTVAPLRDLPCWEARPYPILQLTPPTWPDNPSVYTHLASVVPTRYQSWVLGVLPDTVLQYICTALNEHRAGLGLPRVLLMVVGQGVNREVGDHVYITYHTEPGL